MTKRSVKFVALMSALIIPVIAYGHLPAFDSPYRIDTERVAAVAPAPHYEVEIIRDVAYYEGVDADPVRHKLDLFVPKGAKDFPVLLFFHGGGWSRGEKTYYGMATKLCSMCAQNGIAAASANYRLSPSVKHPAHVQDAARAVAWIHQNIGKYGGQAEHLFVAGHSAGGHLIALLATDATYLKAHGLSLGCIKGAIPMSAVFRLPKTSRSFEHVFGNDPNIRQAAEPTWQICRLPEDAANRVVPPFLIIYGDNDVAMCGKAPAAEFAQALGERNIKRKVCEVKDRNHLTILLKASQADDPAGAAILDFIRQNTGG